ncbi:MAG: para-aminobenzoate synthetase component 1 [Reinekea sp.]
MDNALQVLTIAYLSEIITLTDVLSEHDGFIWFHNGPETPSGLEWFSAWPTETYQYLGNQKCRISSGSNEVITVDSDFFELLKQKAPCLEFADLPHFTGGLAGHLNYELGSELLNLNSPISAMNQPIATVGLYHWACCIDHNAKTISVYIRPECPEVIRQQVVEWVHALPNESIQRARPKRENLNWNCSMSIVHYREAFNAIKKYIYDGDIYQANLTRQWSCITKNSPWVNYQLLINSMSAPFSFYHSTPETKVMSVSPERFIQVNDHLILTQPIKGTRPRGQSAEEDTLLKNELSSSKKDQAENLMIVDLLRNDMAKNAVPGTVKVEKLFELQTFKNVHHLVSSIHATKKPSVHPIDVLKDAFPGGSITGAPKKRAMEVINEVEPVPRGQYCGSAFFMSFEGYLDSSILIRTMSQNDETLVCSGGGGIVYDSQLESEYKESDLKIRRLLDALSDNQIN